MALDFSEQDVIMGFPCQLHMRCVSSPLSADLATQSSCIWHLTSRVWLERGLRVQQLNDDRTQGSGLLTLVTPLVSCRLLSLYIHN